MPLQAVRFHVAVDAEGCPPAAVTFVPMTSLAAEPELVAIAPRQNPRGSAILILAVGQAKVSAPFVAIVVPSALQAVLYPACFGVALQVLGFGDFPRVTHCC
ncbi:MAG: hypothetical protein GY772_09650 [bacterium]|nr:hypothetical protein [bacterium]